MWSRLEQSPASPCDRRALRIFGEASKRLRVTQASNGPLGLPRQVEGVRAEARSPRPKLGGGMHPRGGGGFPPRRSTPSLRHRNGTGRDLSADWHTKVLAMSLHSASLLFGILAGPRIGLRLRNKALGWPCGALLVVVVSAALLWIGPPMGLA